MWNINSKLLKKGSNLIFIVYLHIFPQLNLNERKLLYERIWATLMRFQSITHSVDSHGYFFNVGEIRGLGSHIVYKIKGSL